jgi:hypothetical protein
MSDDRGRLDALLAELRRNADRDRPSPWLRDAVMRRWVHDFEDRPPTGALDRDLVEWSRRLAAARVFGRLAAGFALTASLAALVMLMVTLENTSSSTRAPLANRMPASQASPARTASAVTPDTIVMPDQPAVHPSVPRSRDVEAVRTAKPPGAVLLAPVDEPPAASSASDRFLPLSPFAGEELGSARVMRVRLSGEAVRTLGVRVPALVVQQDGFVQADVILGEDGVARAIRLLQ